MKTTVLTPHSSVKSTTTTMESEPPENSYFPGCRRDANCTCEICIASINATLDLIPQSFQRSSLTIHSSSKPFKKTPISFNPSFLSTPHISKTHRGVAVSPPLNSTARVCFRKKAKKKREFGFGLMLMRLVLCVTLVFVVEFGFSWVVSGVFKPKLDMDMVWDLGEKSWVLKDLNERMMFLKEELESLVDGKVSNCSSGGSMWDINQDGLLLNSRCILYKSAVEEVSIWGWPLQTSGLLTAEFSPRSFTVLSGRVTEWFNGEVSYLIRKENSSWAQRKWSASAVQLDPSTWMLEYRRNSVMENARLISAALEFLNFRMRRKVKNMKQQFWLLSAFGSSLYSDFTGDTFTTPT